MFITAQEQDRREKLHLLLEEQLGSSNVYFQAPPNNLMKYPAIVYERDAANTNFAGNQPYLRVKRYQVTVMDWDPDSVVPDKVGLLTQCLFERHFNADGLNHDVFTIYF